MSGLGLLISMISISFLWMGAPLPLLVGTLFLSVCYVFLIIKMASAWYAYVLFLLYVGGLMVLFIYVCMLSSNQYTLQLPFLRGGFLMLVGGFFCDPLAPFLTEGTSTLCWSGSDLPLAVLLALVVLLLVVFLGLVQIMSGSSVIFPYALKS
uniref:NADH dehydrogenase subunit 6 n=1 Tax=Discus perspectivus TaxID=697275 RepID=UPI002176C3B2|nr:NADH dehydrogenase subunit 6 [Discus perspectivus]UUB71736.1 NADH dehydrogenase subunit 6 [Discus perspectivus]